MTDPPRPDGEGPSESLVPNSAGDASPSDGPAPSGAQAARSLGLTTFTIEGRRAPGLFVVGWLATIIGAGLLVLSRLGMPDVPAAVLSLLGLLALSAGLILLAGSQTIERRASGATYAGPSPWLVFAVVVAVSRLTGFVVGAALLPIAERIPVAVGDLIGAVLQALVFLAVLRLSIVGAGVFRWAEMGWRGSAGHAIRRLLDGAIVAGPVLLASIAVTYVLVQFATAVPASPLPPTGTAGGLALHLLAGALIAPIAEEALFRGFALAAWRRTLTDREAIVRSTVLFMLAHVLFVGAATFRDAASLALVGAGARLPVALALGWVYVRTGSIWAPIGLHATYNAVLIVLGEVALRQSAL